MEETQRYYCVICPGTHRNPRKRRSRQTCRQRCEEEGYNKTAQGYKPTRKLYKQLYTNQRLNSQRGGNHKRNEESKIKINGKGWNTQQCLEMGLENYR